MSKNLLLSYPTVCFTVGPFRSPRLVRIPVEILDGQPVDITCKYWFISRASVQLALQFKTEIWNDKLICELNVTDENYEFKQGTITILKPNPFAENIVWKSSGWPKQDISEKKIRFFISIRPQEFCKNEPRFSESDVSRETENPMLLNKLSTDLETLFIKQSYGDLRIRVGDSFFLVHKYIMAARSIKFALLFRTGAVKDYLYLDNVRCQSLFERMLLYMYCGRIQLKELEDIINLYELASEYEVDSLKSKCLAELKIKFHPDLFGRLNNLAFKHKDRNFKNALLEHLAFKGHQETY